MRKFRGKFRLIKIIRFNWLINTLWRKIGNGILVSFLRSNFLKIKHLYFFETFIFINFTKNFNLKIIK